MSSSVPTNTETISSAGRARGCPIPTPFHDDPYLLVRQAYSPTALDTDSEPLDSPSEVEESQPPSLTSAPLILDYTSATPHTNEELEPSEIPETMSTSPHSTTPPADSISPSSPH
ncbi:hypothetical protein Tco_1153205 [Tanacetum coccineum]